MITANRAKGKAPMFGNMWTEITPAKGFTCTVARKDKEVVVTEIFFVVKFDDVAQTPDGSFTAPLERLMTPGISYFDDSMGLVALETGKLVSVVFH